LTFTPAIFSSLSSERISSPSTSRLAFARETALAP
jgi:hypothetical protein